MAKTIDEFFPDVRVDVPEMALPLVRREIRNALHTFCKKTRVWRERNKLLSLQPGKSEYLISVPEGTRVQDITHLSRKVENTSNPVRYADRTRFKRSEDDLDEEVRNWREDIDPLGQFLYWGLTPERTHLFVTPCPEIFVADAIKFTTALYPGGDVTEVPDFIFDEWSEEIGHGAAANLLRIPNKSWTNEDAAVQRESSFNKAIAVAWRKANSAQPRAKFRGLGT